MKYLLPFLLPLISFFILYIYYTKNFYKIQLGRVD
nr:MAG TPA: hypothetical protein [Caudoviricetes sp.]